MRLSAREEYGLRCLLHLARAAPGACVTIAEIAKAEALTDANIAKLMRLLRQAGLVNSVRGRSGGYTLTITPESLSVSRVVDAIGERLGHACDCGRFSGMGERCVHGDDCAMRGLFAGIDGVVHDFLSGWTLADLLYPEGEIRERIGRRASRSRAAEA
ncbi:MAG: transcriptional regulator [Gemmatimonadetes bacterium]|nr:transcriptional regulator [Gemmatimonadota bacterium]